MPFTNRSKMMSFREGYPLTPFFRSPYLPDFIMTKSFGWVSSNSVNCESRSNTYILHGNSFDFLVCILTNSGCPDGDKFRQIGDTWNPSPCLSCFCERSTNVQPGETVFPIGCRSEACPQYQLNPGCTYVPPKEDQCCGSLECVDSQRTYAAAHVGFYWAEYTENCTSSWKKNLKQVCLVRRYAYHNEFNNTRTGLRNYPVLWVGLSSQHSNTVRYHGAKYMNIEDVEIMRVRKMVICTWSWSNLFIKTRYGNYRKGFNVIERKLRFWAI